MTYSEEIQANPGSMGGAAPVGYFEALGVQFTSTVLGVLLAIAGIGGAGALWWFQVKPMMAEQDTLDQELQTKQTELQQKQASNQPNKLVELEAQLNQEKRIASEVLNAYGKEKQVQTFLLDFNRILTASNIQLVNYEPTPEQPAFIADTSYGAAAQNKLKYQTFNVAFEEMTYAQVDSMLENLDLLQPLIVLRNFSTTVSQRATYLYDKNKVTPKEPTKLSVSFVVDALLAPTPEELAKKQEEAAAAAAAAAAPPAAAPPAAAPPATP